MHFIRLFFHGKKQNKKKQDVFSSIFFPLDFSFCSASCNLLSHIWLVYMSLFHIVFDISGEHIRFCLSSVLALLVCSQQGSDNRVHTYSKEPD